MAKYYIQYIPSVIRRSGKLNLVKCQKQKYKPSMAHSMQRLFKWMDGRFSVTNIELYVLVIPTYTLMVTG